MNITESAAGSLVGESVIRGSAGCGYCFYLGWMGLLLVPLLVATSKGSSGTWVYFNVHRKWACYQVVGLALARWLSRSLVRQDWPWTVIHKGWNQVPGILQGPHPGLRAVYVAQELQTGMSPTTSSMYRQECFLTAIRKGSSWVTGPFQDLQFDCSLWASLWVHVQMFSW